MLHFRTLFCLFLLITGFCINAQNYVAPQLDLAEIKHRLSKIKINDPQYIPIHSLFLEDLLEEVLKQQADSAFCEGYNSESCALKRREYEEITQNIRTLKQQAKANFEKIDALFVEKAEEYYWFGQSEDAFYWFNKALEYRPESVLALIRKAEFLLLENQFEECVKTIHRLYHIKNIERQFEMQTSDLTNKLYRQLVEYGDSLLKNENSGDALSVFNLLETFCNNIPSGYCNEDYYLGLIRSKKGVFESYLAIADAAMEREKYDLAAKFIAYAKTYHAENEDYLTASDEIKYEQKLEKLEAELPQEEKEIIVKIFEETVKDRDTDFELIEQITKSYAAAEWEFQCKRFKTGFEFYEQVELLYFKQFLLTENYLGHNLKILPLIQYVYQSRNQKLYDAAAQYLTEKGRYKEALELMKMNKNKLYNPEFFQEELGKKYRAYLYHKGYRSYDFRPMIKKEGLNTPEFIIFQKAFLNQRFVYDNKII